MKVEYDSATPYIACFIILKRSRLIAMVLRKNTGWMDGYFGLPAGKVEWKESYIMAAKREVLEEAGVVVKPEHLKHLHTAHRHSKDSDWVDIYFEASKWEGVPYNAEPEKSEELAWLNLDDLPDNIVPPQRAALIEIARGRTYSEFGWK